MTLESPKLINIFEIHSYDKINLLYIDRNENLSKIFFPDVVLKLTKEYIGVCLYALVWVIM